MAPTKIFRSPLISVVGTVLSATLLTVLHASLPEPKEKRTIRLVSSGEMILEDLHVYGAAVIDENKVVFVGSKSAPEDADPDTLMPNGVIVDLSKKTVQPFTNGHTARIKSVSVARGQVATVSTKRDPVLRIWDLKAGKTIKKIEINTIFDNLAEKYRDGGPPDEYDAVAWFHKSNRLAIAASDYVILLNPERPDDLSLLRTPLLTRRDRKENVILPDWWTKEPVAISPSDAWVACPVGRTNAVFWSLKTGKATDISLIPKGSRDTEEWSVNGVTFSSSGKLFAWRTGNADEVPEGKAEKEVPAERRGVTQIELIDIPEGKIVPLGIGQSIYTLSCAIDPTETWLATGGTGRLDQPRPDAKVGGELRLYHLPSGKLVYHTQPKGSLPLIWLSFTPSGKRIVGATLDGVVRWWDVPRR